ncbi:MAG TPA: hypothetical protein VMU47_06610 [Caldimonas sp.]|nr:hypothetical protein [Caldimonas sp.]
MIEPTVGRVVWIRDRPGAISRAQPEVALITFVRGPSYINVVGWNANGHPFNLHEVPLKQDDPEFDTWRQGYQGAFAEWMPYQKGQAARTEQLERAARAT